jgi:hypothetical protein
LGCADLSALFTQGGLTPHASSLTIARDQSRPTKALTGQRTPNVCVMPLRNHFSIVCLLLTFVATAAVISLAAQTESPRSLPAIKSQAEFDAMAVTYDPDTPYALPHVLFVIDRKDQNKIYYVNTKRYAFHKDFVNGTYLSLERGREFFENNYLKPNRRFILGTIAYQTPLKRWTFEFWEGDLVPPEQIKLAADVIKATFFAAVAYKPNSIRQDEASRNLAGLVRVLQSDIAKEQEYQALNVPRFGTYSYHSQA